MEVVFRCKNAKIKNRIYSKKSKNQLHQRGKFVKQKLLQMIQVTVPNFFYFDEISKIWPLQSKNSHFWPFSEKRPYFLDFGKKEIWNSNLDHLEQLLCCKLCSKMKLIFSLYIVNIGKCGFRNMHFRMTIFG